YFDRARATSPRPVRTHRDAVQLHLWSYAHLPLYIGMIVAFVGIQLVVSVAPEPALSRGQTAMLIGALVTVTLSMRTIMTVSGLPGTAANQPAHNSDPLTIQA